MGSQLHPQAEREPQSGPRLQTFRRLQRADRAGVLSVAAVRTRLLSWNAHLAHGHTWHLRRRLFAGLPYAADLP